MIGTLPERLAKKGQSDSRQLNHKRMKLIVRVLKHGAPYFSAILFALPLAYIISWAVNKFWPGSRWIVFVAVVLFWVNGVIQVILRNIRSGEKALTLSFPTPPIGFPRNCQRSSSP